MRTLAVVAPLATVAGQEHVFLLLARSIASFVKVGVVVWWVGVGGGRAPARRPPDRGHLAANACHAARPPTPPPTPHPPPPPHPQLYLLFLFMRVLLSWFPAFNWDRQPWLALRQLTDPYLSVFRGFVPPLFGAIDFTPLLGFFILQYIQGFLEMMVMEEGRDAFLDE